MEIEVTRGQASTSAGIHALVYRRFAKRLCDFLGALLLVIILAPLFLAIGLAIRLETSGPIFFTQVRPGLVGKRFRIWKFRTMHVGAEQRFAALSAAQKQEFERFGKIKDDPRVTRVGAHLRKWSLDELPQLYNVLRGEMSLVGPRAYLMSQVERLGHHGNTILSVKPGLTGLWQVSGRSNVSHEMRLELDARYVRTCSFLTDVQILWRTVGVLVRSEGAY
jgi:lipopolysaccharide/colanic/teichoic acid biosynthesis glycosyltransferase